MFKTRTTEEIKSTKEWFCQLELLEDNLTKCLLLATILCNENLIDHKEFTQIKRFLMESKTRKTSQILSALEKSKSLFFMRCELRGHMGLPRMRASD